MVRSSGIYILAVVGALLLGGCSTPSPYSYVSNWSIRQNATPAYFAEYDVLFFYPCLSRSADRWPDLPPDHTAYSYAYEFTKFMTQDVFGRKARVFAPIVHRTDDRAFDALVVSNVESYVESAAAREIDETVEAIEYYLENYHEEGHPYVLIGHGQGAVLLYEAVKRLKGVVRPDDGCVAVYLPELPAPLVRLIPEDFAEENHRKYLAPVRGSSDTGVVVAWRTEEATNLTMTSGVRAPRGFINPLNWSTLRPAETNGCKEARFYDLHAADVLERKKTATAYCRAEIDATNLVLRVARADGEALPAIPLKGETVSLFAGNLAENAKARVERYLQKSTWDGWETEEEELPILDEVIHEREEEVE